MEPSTLRQHWAMLYRFLLYLLGDRHDAQDLTQETFRVALAKGPDPAKGSDIGAWLRSIARNLARNHARKRHGRALLLSDDFLEAAERHFIATGSDQDEVWQARRAALAGCLEKLSDENRDLVRRRYERGERVQATAARLGIAPNTLSKRLERVRQGLRRCIADALRGESRD